jgi:Ran GTPase-activating protein (RanGAP) involved in mRNA processing and transport
MNDALNCLINNLGVVETEVFISKLMSEPFDYTEWRKNQFDDVSLEELNAEAVKYSKINR